MKCLACGVKDVDESEPEKVVRLKACRRCRAVDRGAIERTPAEADGHGQIKQPAHAAIAGWLSLRKLKLGNLVEGPMPTTVLDLTADQVAEAMDTVRAGTAEFVEGLGGIEVILERKDFTKQREAGVTAFGGFDDADVAFIVCRIMPQCIMKGG